MKENAMLTTPKGFERLNFGKIMFVVIGVFGV